MKTNQNKLFYKFSWARVNKTHQHGHGLNICMSSLDKGHSGLNDFKNLVFHESIHSLFSYVSISRQFYVNSTSPRASEQWLHGNSSVIVMCSHGTRSWCGHRQLIDTISVSVTASSQPMAAHVMQPINTQIHSVMQFYDHIYSVCVQFIIALI